MKAFPNIRTELLACVQSDKYWQTHEALDKALWLLLEHAFEEYSRLALESGVININPDGIDLPAVVSMQDYEEKR